MSNTLNFVRGYFPEVEKVINAAKDMTINVTKHDAAIAKEKDHSNCGLAQAIKRKMRHEKVIVGVSTAYIIKGKTAIRYNFPESVRREIVSNDRGAGFDPGTYMLKAPVRRDIPGTKESTTNAIVRVLRQAGNKGVPKRKLLDEISHQSPARICELQDRGYEIVSKKVKPCDKLSTYFLVKEPVKPPSKKVRNINKPTRKYRKSVHRTKAIRAVLGSSEKVA